ncbi:hypothetical protein MLD38_034501 [Melastoma candidum]|uniref:Uncharacterized protein n=1 Tax=Melastoma candidum TaxID=119954 RepID=A0ACB9ME85_9MYRT|nr:hypothetical protein MLD38_034501 [Melastoma candidum]
MMAMLTQAARAPPASSSLKKPVSPSSHPIATASPVPPIFSSSSSSARRRFPPPYLARANADDSATAAAPKYPSSAPPPDDEGPVFVGQQDVSLEGVIQFERPGQASRLKKWGRVALLAGGDVVALLIFAAIGRFSHGFAVLDLDTLRTADPFVAGWFLAAYFLGGYGDEGRGEKGFSSAVISAIKSWALGVPLGLSIRALLTGHIPQYNFIIVSMGSTAVLLLGWRTLLSSILPYDKSKTNDDYRRGSPFELFELLTSLVRRW